MSGVTVGNDASWQTTPCDGTGRVTVWGAQQVPLASNAESTHRNGFSVRLFFFFSKDFFW